MLQVERNRRFLLFKAPFSCRRDHKVVGAWVLNFVVVLGVRVGVRVVEFRVQARDELSVVCSTAL